MYSPNPLQVVGLHEASVSTRLPNTPFLAEPQCLWKPHVDIPRTPLMPPPVSLKRAYSAYAPHLCNGTRWSHRATSNRRPTWSKRLDLFTKRPFSRRTTPISHLGHNAFESLPWTYQGLPRCLHRCPRSGHTALMPLIFATTRDGPIRQIPKDQPKRTCQLKPRMLSTP